MDGRPVEGDTDPSTEAQREPLLHEILMPSAIKGHSAMDSAMSRWAWVPKSTRKGSSNLFLRPAFSWREDALQQVFQGRPTRKGAALSPKDIMTQTSTDAVLQSPCETLLELSVLDTGVLIRFGNIRLAKSKKESPD